MNTIPRTKIISPRLPASIFHVYAPRTIANEPNTSGTTNKLTAAQIDPSNAYDLVDRRGSAYLEYEGADGGGTDRGDEGKRVSCGRRRLPHLPQKAASSGFDAPQFGQTATVSPNLLESHILF